MKHSPLCSRNDGCEVYFTAKDGPQKLRFTAPQGLLDDVCGADAPETARKTWVKENMTDILQLRTGDGTARMPFARIQIEEIA